MEKDKKKKEKVYFLYIFNKFFTFFCKKLFIFNNIHAIIKMQGIKTCKDSQKGYQRFGNGNRYEDHNLRKTDDSKRQPQGSH